MSNDIKEKVEAFKKSVKEDEESFNSENSPYHKLVDISDSHRQARAGSEMDFVFRAAYDELDKFLVKSFDNFHAHKDLKLATCLLRRIHGNFR